MSKQINERELVLGILMEVLEQGRYSHIVLREVLGKYQYLEKKERAFITRVSEGTIERLLELDYILDQFSKVKVKKMKPVIRNILRSAVYQLKYMDNVPDSAVCNEAVKLAVKRGFGSLRGFVNGVLRSIARDIDKIEYPTEPLQALSVKYSVPEWILKTWSKTYDSDTIETMLRAFLEEKPLTVRSMDETPEGVENLISQLEAEGVHVKRHSYLPYALELSGFDYLEDLESFNNGMFSVQDISSMLVCEVADPKEGDCVIDVCAAPGGKAVHMAEKLHGTGFVQARDLTEYKVNLIWDNIDRTGLENIEAVQWDALVLDEAAAGKADIVIADLPCSGLGVFGKKTDLKYKIKEESLESLAGLQREILANVQAYVKPGGKLIYSTCTVNPAENIENVHWMLENYPEFELTDIRPVLSDELKGDVAETGCLQFIPGIHKSDGFFVAAMRRKTKV
ncbi:MAG: 16S rRNA (cytosine(967)-C(5))-methyltransferase RsmB [Ruminococcus sp.]|nr:16S rRNA (cytosine(967)-C(5))-methyltransferase RsmB [Ruminococcus sp.]